MHIHIWTGSMGGHRRIAEALEWALRAAQPDVTIRVVDAYSPALVQPGLARVINVYDRLVAGAPWLWRPLYHLTNQPATLRTVRAIGARFTPPVALGRAWAERPADVVVN